MPFFKSDKFFNAFLAILIVFALKTTNFAQAIDKTNFRIDTLKAYWTSGVAPAQIRGSIYLSFKIPAGKEAKVLMKTGPTGIYTAVGTFGDLTSIQTQHHTTRIPNLLVRDEIYCFYLELKNGASTLVTKELCSIPILKEEKLSPNNKLIFTLGSYQPGVEFQAEVYRPIIIGKCLLFNYGCITDSTTFATNNNPTYRATSVYGSEVKCGESKFYEAQIEINGMISISDTLNYIGYTKKIPPTLRDSKAFASIENDKVKLVWKNDETEYLEPQIESYVLEKEFILERKDGINGIYNPINDPYLIRKLDNFNKKWSFVDKGSTPSKIQHYYRLKYVDYCENYSEPIDVVPIFLEQDNSFALIWNNENNSKIVDYELEFYDNLTSDPRKTFLIQPKGNKFKAETSNFYRIKAKLNPNLPDSPYIYSNFIPNNENITVLNPNVFTPDGKGPADSETFKVFSTAAYTFEIIIYDRNGLMVYYSDNYQAHRRDGWNGKLIYTDIDCKEDQYVFQVNVTNSNHKGFVKRGNVLLVRE